LNDGTLEHALGTTPAAVSGTLGGGGLNASTLLLCYGDFHHACKRRIALRWSKNERA